MRRNVLFVMAVIGVCLAFGLSAPSAQKPGRARATGAVPAPADGGGPIGGIGPGFGGRGYPVPVLFRGVTTQRFPLGVGALTLSRACNEELPLSRLCEWNDIFRAIPPIATLDGEVLVAANYDSRPAPMCLNPGGGARCSQAIVMRPAACCGYPPPPPTPSSLTLTPSTPQTIANCADSFDFMALATDANNAPLAGVPIYLNFIYSGNDNSVVGFFSPSTGVTDANGTFSTRLSFNPAYCEAQCTDPATSCSTEIQALTYNSIYSNIVEILDGIQ